jgi:hypothetical protein
MIRIEGSRNRADFISIRKTMDRRVTSSSMGRIQDRVNRVVIISTPKTKNLNNFIISIRIFSKMLNIIKNSKVRNKSKLSTMILFSKI